MEALIGMGNAKQMEVAIRLISSQKKSCEGHVTDGITLILSHYERSSQQRIRSILFSPEMLENHLNILFGFSSNLLNNRNFSTSSRCTPASMQE